MINDGENFNDFFGKMEEGGVVYCGGYWIEKAVEQKNPRLTLDLAYSKLLFYDPLDIGLLYLNRLN
jgi:hypothetical protein